MVWCSGGSSTRSALGESCHLICVTCSPSSNDRFALCVPCLGAAGSKANDDLGISKHLLFYKFDDEEVFVLRVVHGARDLERLFS